MHEDGTGRLNFESSLICMRNIFPLMYLPLHTLNVTEEECFSLNDTKGVIYNSCL